MAFLIGNRNLIEITRLEAIPDNVNLIPLILDYEAIGTGNPEWSPPVVVRIVREDNLKVTPLADNEFLFNRPHGMATGDTAWVYGFGGLYELNGEHEVTVTSPTTLTIEEAFNASHWTGGGKVRALIYGPVNQFNNVLTPEQYAHESFVRKWQHIVPETVEFAPEKRYAVCLSYAGRQVPYEGFGQFYREIQAQTRYP